MHPPETMRRGRFRPCAYPCSKLLQTDGGLCHPAPASLFTWSASGRAPSLNGRYPASSLLRTHPSGSRLRRASPFGSHGYLSSAAFLRGARSPSLFRPMALCACCRLYPAERTPPSSPSRWPAAFADIVMARRSVPFLITGPRPDVHLIVTARALAHPTQGGASSVGFALRHLPRERHPSYAASTFAASGLSPYGPMGTSRQHTTFLRMRCVAKPSAERIGSSSAPTKAAR